MRIGIASTRTRQPRRSTTNIARDSSLPLIIIYRLPAPLPLILQSRFSRSRRRRFERTMERNHMPAPAEPPSYSQPHVPRHVQLPPIPSVEPLSLDERPTAPTSSMLRESLPRPVEPVERYQPTSWPSSNPFVSYYQQPQPPNGSSSSRSFRRVDSPGAMDLDDSRPHRGGSVVSIDDPDVRLAAEALGDLRAGIYSSNARDRFLWTSH